MPRGLVCATGVCVKRASPKTVEARHRMWLVVGRHGLPPLPWYPAVFLVVAAAAGGGEG